MFNRLLLTAGLATGMIITGCATTETPTAPKLPHRFVSTVSSSTGLFIPSRNTPIQWDGKLEITDSASLLPPERAQLLNGLLKEELNKLGYQFSAKADNARFAMKAVLLMGRDADKKQLEALSGVAPELQEGAGAHSGALGIQFTDIDTQQIVWKSASEVVTQSQTPEQEQIQRVRHVIQQMLSGLPTAK